jgi:hypothetical protein
VFLWSAAVEQQEGIAVGPPQDVGGGRHIDLERRIVRCGRHRVTLPGRQKQKREKRSGRGDLLPGRYRVFFHRIARFLQTDLSISIRPTTDARRSLIGDVLARIAAD